MLQVYLTQIMDTLNELSPRFFSLGDENVGLCFGRKTDVSDVVIKKSLVVVDPTIDSIEKAANWNANLIISHHKLFFDSFLKIKEIVHEKIRILSERNIWVYVLGTSWIAAEEGISKSLCQGLKLEPSQVFNVLGPQGSPVPLGRICNLEEKLTLVDLVEQVKSIIKSPLRVNFSEGNASVNNVLVIGGDIKKVDWIEEVLEKKVDTIITGEINHEILCILDDLNIKVLQLGHYHADLFGMSKLKFLLSLKHPNVDFDLHENTKQSYKLP